MLRQLGYGRQPLAWLPFPGATPPTQVVFAARDLGGARDIAAVLDARIRARTGQPVPQPQGPWAGRVPQLPDPERRAYLAGIAALMDDRTRRLGQHTTRTAPAWAVAALRPVPGDTAARRDWERKASPIAAYRETYGYDHPGDPIGPEPAHDAPDQRAAWHQAGGSGVRAMPDGRLWLLCDTYLAATAWAPPHPGKELRLARLGAFDVALAACRADAEATAARKAGDNDRARRHETLAASYRALHHHYQQREQTLAQVMTDRQAWEHATADTRYLAIAADAELRRRHPGQKIEPLRSAEPAPISDTQRAHPHPAPGRQPVQTAPWIRDLVLRHQASCAGIDESPQLTAPDGDPTRGDLSKVFPGRHASGNTSILQPPRPEIIPSERILQLAAEHDTEPGHEAAD